MLSVCPVPSQLIVYNFTGIDVFCICVNLLQVEQLFQFISSAVVFSTVDCLVAQLPYFSYGAKLVNISV